MVSIAALFASLLALTFVVVPLDDRPVTAQLPRLLGAIAGVRVAEPPRPLLGQLSDPGRLRTRSCAGCATTRRADARAYVVSQRHARVRRARRLAHPRRLARRSVHAAAGPRGVSRRAADASFAVFGTVMRLAPTGVPRLGAGGVVSVRGRRTCGARSSSTRTCPIRRRPMQQRALAAQLRAQLGPALDAYLATRARDRDVDLFALRLAAEGAFDRIVARPGRRGPRRAAPARSGRAARVRADVGAVAARVDRARRGRARRWCCSPPRSHAKRGSFRACA